MKPSFAPLALWSLWFAGILQAPVLGLSHFIVKQSRRLELCFPLALTYFSVFEFSEPVHCVCLSGSLSPLFTFSFGGSGKESLCLGFGGSAASTLA